MVWPVFTFVCVARLMLMVFVQGDSSQFSSQENTLRLLHVLYRHGDRTPISTYPLDPYKDIKNWPVTWGQLTNEGKQRHYNLGSYVRQRYGSFLSESYSPDEVYVRSTDVDRTLMSAESHLAGLFPPTADQLWNPSIPWQPIPVHTVPKSEDLLLRLDSDCPQYDELVEELRDTAEIREVEEANKQLYEYLTQNTGKNVTSVEDIEYLYDALFIESRYNLTLPNWTSTVFPDRLRPLSDFSFAMKAYTRDMQRLRGGPLVKEMVDNMKSYSARVLTPAPRKLFMYSAHDVTVAVFLSALDAFNNIQPPYAAMVLVELHEVAPANFSVTILYKNVSSDGSDPFVLTIPGCQALCPLDTFVQLTRPVISEDVVAECRADFRFDGMSLIVAGSAVAVLLSLLILTAVVLLGRRCFRDRSHDYQYLTIQTE